jgi:hypothetical protein
LSGLDVDAGGADFVDPFTGRLFLHRRDAGGFAVYGVGANLKDDGGQVARQRYRIQATVGAAGNPGARDAGVVVERTSGNARQSR